MSSSSSSTVQNMPSAWLSIIRTRLSSTIGNAQLVAIISSTWCCAERNASSRRRSVMSREIASNCTTAPSSFVIGVTTESNHFATPDAVRIMYWKRPRSPRRACSSAASAAAANVAVEESGERALHERTRVGDLERPQSFGVDVEQASVERENLRAVAGVLDDAAVEVSDVTQRVVPGVCVFMRTPRREGGRDRGRERGRFEGFTDEREVDPRDRFRASQSASPVIITTGVGGVRPRRRSRRSNPLRPARLTSTMAQSTSGVPAS
jgi:hypothetical protein